MSKINTEWHRKHKFPKDGNEEQKDVWRKEHKRNCGCGRKRFIKKAIK